MGQRGSLRRQACAIPAMLTILLQCIPGFSINWGAPGGDTFLVPHMAGRQISTKSNPPTSPFNAGTVPATFFSMTVQSGIFKETPWPFMPVGGIRLWDTFTNWNDIEPSRGIYNWPALDRWLTQAQAHGADVLYTFGGTPTWASLVPTGACDYNPGGCYPPMNMQDWDDYVRAIATHAAGRIKYWELWNEASQHEYWSGGVPALVTMAQHAFTIIKSVDPSAKVFTPSGVGGAMDTSTFLDQFLVAGGGQFVDGVAFHGYGNALPSSPEEINRIVDAVQGIMAKRGFGDRPLWDTEASWGPANHLPNEEDRIAFVSRHYILQWSKGVQRSYWYAWNDTNYGTLWDMGTHKIRRAGIAYGEVENWLKGAEMTAPCAVSSDATWTCGFILAGGAQSQVVWNSSASTLSTLQFRPAAKYVQYRNLDGDTMQITGGSIRIGSKPLLLIAGDSHSLHGPSNRGDDH